MKSLIAVAAVAALLSPVSAHFYIDQLNGESGALRPISGMGQENFPVQGNDIIGDNIICNSAKPFDAYASAPVTVSAGSSVTLHWTNGPKDPGPIGAAHYGPCHVYLGKGLKPTGWTKIYETTPDNAGDWCTNLIANNNNNYVVPIPAGLAPGQYVLRAHLAALHAAGQPGGAQFYPRCMDIIVTGSGTSVPPFSDPIPGTWDLQTPGVLFDLYANNKNPADGGSYKGYYPSWGGKLWVPSNNPATSRVVTTTARSPSPAVSPIPGQCQVKNNQCGGQTYKGNTVCCAGLTCTPRNVYYSQCV